MNYVKAVTAIDFYKSGHVFQYPFGTQNVYSNWTARSATHASMPASFDNKVVWYGMQGFIKSFLIELWNETFFSRPKEEVVAEYKRRMDTSLGPNAVDVAHIAALHDLGYLPLLIKALPEGSRVDLRVPMMTIQSTHPEFFWLTNYIETALSAELWKMCTVATVAYEYRRILMKYVELTGSNKDFANWQLHGFEMRGMSGISDANASSGHIVAAGFGTDTIPAIDYLEAYYNANAETELIAGSVPATEHSVMCMGGFESEVETFRRLITQVYPEGIVSIVSDTWDFWKVITEYSVELKDEILNRTPNALGMAKVVFRPDSGDPVKIVAGLTYVDLTGAGLAEAGYDAVNYPEPDVVKFCGKFYEYELESDWSDIYNEPYNQSVVLRNEVPEHVVKGAIECLWDIFGGDITDWGYKTLNQRVGLIYGDSITLERAEQILKRLMDKGFSAGNIVFGVGSYTYQYMTRDTFGFAVKATWGVVNGEERMIYKDPKTDNGTKKSAKGLLRVELEDGKFVLYDEQTKEQEQQGLLQPVFVDGKIVKETSLAEIRQRLWS